MLTHCCIGYLEATDVQSDHQNEYIVDNGVFAHV